MSRLDLLQTVADFKSERYAQTYARFDLARHASTLRLLPERRVIRELKMDYSRMAPMCFHDPPAYDEVLATLRGLQEELRDSKE